MLSERSTDELRPQGTDTQWSCVAYMTLLAFTIDGPLDRAKEKVK